MSNHSSVPGPTTASGSRQTTTRGLPEGWQATRMDPNADRLSYIHSETGIVVNIHPDLWSETAKRSIQTAVSLGRLPENCQAFLQRNDRVVYRLIKTLPFITEASASAWHTLKHPTVIEKEVDDFISDYRPEYQESRRVSLLTTRGHENISLDLRDVRRKSGILLVENIDGATMSNLRNVFSEERQIPFFVVSHVLVHVPHESPWETELVGDMARWFPMSFGGPAFQQRWAGIHFDIMFDDSGRKLHFGFAQFFDECDEIVKERIVFRISMFDISSHLTLALLSNSRPDWQTLHDTYRSERGKLSMQPGPPRWFTPAIPAYLCPGEETAEDLRDYLLQSLQAVTRYQAEVKLPLALRRDRRSRRSKDAPAKLSQFYKCLLPLHGWQDGFQRASQEMDYYWERAIVGPETSDFSRLKVSRKNAEKLHREFGAWLVQMDAHLKSPREWSEEKLMGELRGLQEQMSGLKQEITDTFQLLIGAIAIKDSEIQKKLAHESKIQAKRSTALTALAAVYLPLSLATGVFGMNIAEINQGVPKYWAVVALGLGLLVSSVPFMVWVFRDEGVEVVRRDMVARGRFDLEEERIYSRGGVRHIMDNASGSFRRRRGEAQPRSSGRTEQSGDTV